MSAGSAAERRVTPTPLWSIPSRHRSLLLQSNRLRWAPGFPSPKRVFMSVSPSSSSWQALVRLLRYARGYRTRVVLASLCSIINKLFDIAPEILIGIAIDVIVNRQESFVAALGFTTPQSQILALAGLTLFIWVGESLFEYLHLIL